MYTLVYTKCLEHADDVMAFTETYASESDAVRSFHSHISNIVSNAVNNSLLNVNISIFNNKCVAKVESVTHCIVITKN